MSNPTLEIKKPKHHKYSYVGKNLYGLRSEDIEQSNLNKDAHSIVFPYSAESKRVPLVYTETNKFDKRHYHSSEKLILAKIQITGSKKVSLAHLEETIEEAKVLLSYKYDWDDNEGEPTNHETFQRASDFIINYGRALASAGYSLLQPYIDIMGDGSISLKWDTAKAEFFMIFRKHNAEYSYFYGESKNKEMPAKIKNGVKTGSLPDEMLLAWMKHHLTD